jgi:cyclopropane-fatty-acyl-phospholipid synthase
MSAFCLWQTELTQGGKAAASGLIGMKCDLLVNPKPMVPSWTEAGARYLVARNLDQYISIGNFW